MKDKPHSGWPCTAVTPQNEEHLDQLDLRCELADYNQGTVYRAEYWLQCIGNNGDNVGISQSLHQVGPTNAHTGTERTPYASLSGPTEPT